MISRLAAFFVALVGAMPIAIAAPVKIGLVSTLSGANAAPGIDIRDGFLLAMRQRQGQLGGLAAQVIVVDDQQRSDLAKEKIDRLVHEDRVDFLTGIVFSDIMLAVGPEVFAARTFYVSAHAAPSRYAGEQCNPYFFSVAPENDSPHEAAAKFLGDQGFTSIIVIAAGDAAGRDAVAGFRRYYGGRTVEEVYVHPGQLDFTAEIARARAMRPQALYFSLPGQMGSNFVKQSAAAGLSREIQLFAAGQSADEDTIRQVGFTLQGIFNIAPWNHDLDNDANRKFVADFREAFGRQPSLYAAQGYDAAQLIDAAIRQLQGRLSDHGALRRALETARFSSVRGQLHLGSNHFPVQDYFLRVVGKDSDGRLTNRTLSTLLARHVDSYARRCAMR